MLKRWILILITLAACGTEPQLAQITSEDIGKAFEDYNLMIDGPTFQTSYGIFVNEDSNWWTENNDSLYYASQWIAVVPDSNPYYQTLLGNPKFRYIRDIIIDSRSKVDIKLFIDYYEKHRKYVPTTLP